MSVSVISFGFKYGIPIEADLVFDVRFLPNPYYIAELRHQTGLDEGVYSFVFGYQQTKDFMAHLESLIGFLLPQYVEEGKAALVIGIGCTGGQHRSVAITKALADFIKQKAISHGEPPGHDPGRLSREGAGIPRPPGPWPQGGRHRRRPRPVQHAAGTEAIYGEYLRHRHGGG